MMQQELLLPRWPSFNFASSVLDHDTPFDQEINFCDFSYSFSSAEDSSVFSSTSYAPTMIPDEFFDLKDSCKELQISSTMEGLETNISSEDIHDIYEWINGDNIQENSSTMEGDGFSPSLSLESNRNSSVFAAMEVDDHDQITLSHLLRAYGEAMENGEKELGEVIVNSINNKSSPLGSTTERVAYSLFQSREEEASMNLAAAFRVLYQSIPNGRFAHFAANSAILDSIPDDAGEVHIVDFDVGEGIQWPPLIEALSRREKALRVRLTLLILEEECTSSCWEFDETKKRLLSHARQYGLRLKIEEKGFQDVCDEVMRERKRGEWLVFNCMVGLPHMGRRWHARSVDGFLEEAKALLAIQEGIIVLGDGEAGENMNNGYALYFDSMIRHYHAVFESLEMNFPAHLAEARAAMESLFLAPFMCQDSWFRDWEERRRSSDFRTDETWLGGRKIRLGSLVEAKEMVVEGENSYNVRIEGMRENEMVLRWKETPLVRISTWM